MRHYLTAAFKNLSCALKCSLTKEMDVDSWRIRTYVWDLFLCQNLTDAFSTASQAVRDSLQSLEYVYKATADLLQLAAFLPLLSSNSLRFILKSNLKHSVLQRLAVSLLKNWKHRLNHCLQQFWERYFLITYFFIKLLLLSLLTVHKTSGVL